MNECAKQMLMEYTFLDATCIFIYFLICIWEGGIALKKNTYNNWKLNGFYGILNSRRHVQELQHQDEKEETLNPSTEFKPNRWEQWWRLKGKNESVFQKATLSRAYKPLSKRRASKIVIAWGENSGLNIKQSYKSQHSWLARYQHRIFFSDKSGKMRFLR